MAQPVQPNESQDIPMDQQQPGYAPAEYEQGAGGGAQKSTRFRAMYSVEQRLPATMKKTPKRRKCFWFCCCCCCFLLVVGGIVGAVIGAAMYQCENTAFSKAETLVMNRAGMSAISMTMKNIFTGHVRISGGGDGNLTVVSDMRSATETALPAITSTFANVSNVATFLGSRPANDNDPMSWWSCETINANLTLPPANTPVNGTPWDLDIVSNMTAITFDGMQSAERLGRIKAVSATGAITCTEGAAVLQANALELASETGSQRGITGVVGGCKLTASTGSIAVKDVTVDGVGGSNTAEFKASTGSIIIDRFHCATCGVTISVETGSATVLLSAGFHGTYTATSETGSIALQGDKITTDTEETDPKFKKTGKINGGGSATVTLSTETGSITLGLAAT